MDISYITQTEHRWHEVSK